MFILVILVLTIQPNGMPVELRSEYQFYKLSDCKMMSKTLATISKLPVRTRCEQVT